MTRAVASTITASMTSQKSHSIGDWQATSVSKDSVVVNHNVVSNSNVKFSRQFISKLRKTTGLYWSFLEQTRDQRSNIKTTDPKSLWVHSINLLREADLLLQTSFTKPLDSVFSRLACVTARFWKCRKFSCKPWKSNLCAEAKSRVYHLEVRNEEPNAFTGLPSAFCLWQVWGTRWWWHKLGCPTLVLLVSDTCHRRSVALTFLFCTCNCCYFCWHVFGWLKSFWHFV